MKHKLVKKVGCGCVLPLIALCCFVMFMIYDSKTINLGNGVTWKIVKYNDSVLKTSDGRVLLGPGYIHLWGKYPYVVGNILRNDVMIDFMIDVRDYNVTFDSSYGAFDFTGIKPTREITPTLDFGGYDLTGQPKPEVRHTYTSNFIGFYDLKGQWAQKGKLAELQAELRDKK